MFTMFIFPLRCARGFFSFVNSLGESICKQCECNNNSDLCNTTSGKCESCQNHTTGDNCEMCEDGWFGDATKQMCSGEAHSKYPPY